MHMLVYSFGAEGNSRFIGATASAMEEILGPHCSAQGWSQDSSFVHRIPQLRQDQSIRAASPLEVVGLFSMFILSCFGKKIFDEIYERTIKLPINAFLDRLFKNIDLPIGESVEIRNVVYLEDIDTVVVIRAVANKENAAQVSRLWLQSHRVAHAYLEQHGPKGPVHCHTIKGTTIDLEPSLYTSLAQLNKATRKI